MLLRPVAALLLASALFACSSSGGPTASSSASASAAPKRAAPPPSSAVVREKPNEVPADPPMKPPLMPGSAATGDGPAVHGVALEKATAADVRAALEKARCKVADAQGAGHATDATCDGHAFLVTFVGAADPPPDAAKLDAAQKGAAVARSGAASLAVQPNKADDAKLAEDLLARITSAP